MIKILKYSLFFGSGALLLFYGIICALIFGHVKSTCKTAQQQFGGEPVDALITMLSLDETSFELKNEAVYALGQIGDRKALPALRDQVTGIPCPKPCTKNGYVCQYDLDKAIRSCQGEFSATKWMYRFL